VWTPPCSGESLIFDGDADPSPVTSRPGADFVKGGVVRRIWYLNGVGRVWERRVVL
jgi:hypothetical protein